MLSNLIARVAMVPLWVAVTMTMAAVIVGVFLGFYITDLEKKELGD